jgi:hypothetical protein
MLTIRHLVYGIIVFLIVVGVGIQFMAESKITSYADKPYKYQEFNQSFNKISKVNNFTIQTNRTLSSKPISFGDFGALNDLINTGWGYIKSGWTSVSAVSDVLTATSQMFGVPRFVVVLLTSAILTLIIFTILSAIFLRDI